MDPIKRNLDRAFSLTLDLAEHLPEEALKLDLGGLPSNTIGQQFWCIVGARESYHKAVMNDKWSGFDCTLEDTTSKRDVVRCLRESARISLDYFRDLKMTESQTEFIFALLEHEVQHHGQLIRYAYGNKLSFPSSWHARYTV